MQWEDKEERARFLAAFAGLCEVKRTDMTKELASIYHRALDDLEIEDVERAIMQAVRFGGPFMPQPGELRESVQGRLEDRATVEAGKVLTAMQSVGSCRGIVFDDPVTAAVVLLGFGGWCAICEAPIRSMQWFTRDFVEHYCSFARQGVEHYGELPGRPYDIKKPPALVGDINRARAALESGRADKAPALPCTNTLRLPAGTEQAKA